MKKLLIYTILPLFYAIFLWSCSISGDSQKGNSDSNNEKKEFLSLNPYTLDTTIVYDPSNVYKEIKRWDTSWIGKEITVIAWCGAGTSPGQNKYFSNLDKPGLIRLKCSFERDVDSTFFQYVDMQTQYTLIKGKIKAYTNSLELENCTLVGAFSDSVLPKNSQITPNSWKSNTPVHSEDIVSSMQAWKGIKILLEGEASMAKKGNVIRFKDKEDKEIVQCTFSTNFEGDGLIKERIISGIIQGINSWNVLSITECILQ